MYLKAEQIEEYASRFVEIPEKRTFPMNGEVFARFIRKRPDNPNVSDEEGWVFGGYGICQGYELNEEAKPLGRSLWWRYLELNSFPPQKICFRLQPPQVIKGIFALQGGDHQMRIIMVDLLASNPKPEVEDEKDPLPHDPSGKIIPFRPKK